MITTLRLKIAAVACLVGGSIVSTVQYLVTPVDGSLDGATLAAEVAQKHTAMAWAAGLDVPVVLLWVPAMLFLGYLAGALKTKLGLAGGLLIFVPLLAAVPGIVGLDYLAFVASGHGDQAAAGALLQGWLDSPLYGVTLLVYLVGHVLGFVLIGIALLRSRAVPAWAAVVIGVFPIVEVATWDLGKAGVLVSGVLGLVGLTVAARVLVTGRSATPATGDGGTTSATQGRTDGAAVRQTSVA